MAGVTPARSKQYFPNSLGAPLAGGLIYTYYAGTTSLADTWQDKDLNTANTNPIVLNARGECSIWLSSALSYKFVVKDSSGATIYTEDNVMGTGDTVAGVSDITVDRFSGTGAQTAFTLSVTPANGENCTEVYVGGVYIQKNAYSVSGAVLTFAVAPASGTNNIEVNTIQYTDYTAAATSVAASASTASTAATAAAASATSAASSATAAAASATAADASADAAAASEAGAAAIVLGDFTQRGTGAEARTFLEKARDFVSILDFIPVAEHAAIRAGTSTYDCYASIMEAVNSADLNNGNPATLYKSGARIYFPMGRYLCNTTIDLKRKVYFLGDHSGFSLEYNTALVFPSGVTGIRIQSYNTTGESGTEANTTSAQGTIIEGLRIEGPGKAVGAAAYGILMRARALIRNCYIRDFRSHGIYILATAPNGNCNLWRIEGGASEVNGGCGLFIEGADTNAGYSIGFDASFNDEYGIYDSSFLGNLHLAPHTDGNTLGPYKSDDPNANSIFISAYAEGGQPLGSIAGPAMAIGGNVGSSGPRILTSTGGFSIKEYMRWDSKDGTSGTYFIPQSDGTVDGVGAVDNVPGGPANFSAPFRMRARAGGFFWEQASAEVLTFYDNATATVANAFSREISSTFGLILGIPRGYLDKGGRSRNTAAAAPVAGARIVGDFTWNEAPAVGGPIGWACTTAGTPGTHSQFGEIIGSGGTVAQATGKTTGVTLDKRTGQITMEATGSIAAGAIASFTLTNSTIGADDVVHVQRKSGGTAGAYRVWCDSSAAGSCVICVENRTAGPLAEAVVLQFRALLGAVA
jgi:hypothetical protein